MTTNALGPRIALDRHVAVVNQAPVSTTTGALGVAASRLPRSRSVRALLTQDVLPASSARGTR